MSDSCQQAELTRWISGMHGCAFLPYKCCITKTAGCLFYHWPIALKAILSEQRKSKTTSHAPSWSGSSETCGEEGDEAPVGWGISGEKQHYSGPMTKGSSQKATDLISIMHYLLTPPRWEKKKQPSCHTMLGNRWLPLRQPFPRGPGSLKLEALRGNRDCYSNKGHNSLVLPSSLPSSWRQKWGSSNRHKRH